MGRYFTGDFVLEDEITLRELLTQCPLDDLIIAEIVRVLGEQCGAQTFRKLFALPDPETAEARPQHAFGRLGGTRGHRAALGKRRRAIKVSSTAVRSRSQRKDYF